MSDTEISVGSWKIYEDASGNLVIENGGSKLTIDNAPGQVTVNEKWVLCDGDPININNDQGTLDGTTHEEGPGKGWQAATYWSDDQDGDCNLEIHYGHPW